MCASELTTTMVCLYSVIFNDNPAVTEKADSAYTVFDKLHSLLAVNGDNLIVTGENGNIYTLTYDDNASHWKYGPFSVDVDVTNNPNIPALEGEPDKQAVAMEKVFLGLCQSMERMAI